MGRRYETVSLLTDYGLDDEFVGVVKSVIRDLAPHVTIVDLTHGVRPFDVRAGSLALARAIPYVARRASSLGVVDPGVGTSRKAIAVEVADGAGVLVGPDNGLLAPAVGLAGGATRAVELDNVGYHLRGAGGDVRRPRRVRPGCRPPVQRRRPRRARLAARRRRCSCPAMIAAAADRGRTGSTPRCCGSTASATAS